MPAAVIMNYPKHAALVLYTLVDIQRSLNASKEVMKIPPQ